MLLQGEGERLALSVEILRQKKDTVFQGQIEI